MQHFNKGCGELRDGGQGEQGLGAVDASFGQDWALLSLGPYDFIGMR